MYVFLTVSKKKGIKEKRKDSFFFENAIESTTNIDDFPNNFYFSYKAKW